MGKKSTNHLIKQKSLYKDSYSLIKDELQKLDLLLQRCVMIMRVRNNAIPQPENSHMVYISHAEIDWLLTNNTSIETHDSLVSDIAALEQSIDIMQHHINQKKAESTNQGIELSLVTLARLFGLSDFELHVTLICLAPELDKKYDKIYAYLHDDITRKRPSIDLALDVLCRTEELRWQARAYFTSPSPLFHSGIIQRFDDPQSPSGSTGLSQLLRLDPRIVRFILGNNSIDERLLDYAQIVNPKQQMEDVLVDESTKNQVLHYIVNHFSLADSQHQKLIIHLHGPYGVGKSVLACGICQKMQTSIIQLDLELLPELERERDALIALAFREGVLMQAVLCIRNMDKAFKDDDRSKTLLRKLEKSIGENGWLTIFTSEKPCNCKEVFVHTMYQAFVLSVPSIPIRQAAWKKAMQHNMSRNEYAWDAKLADQFYLTPGQINDAAAFAKHQTTEQGTITLVDVYTACKLQSNQKLSECALKIDPHYSWDDLVLPEANLVQLKEICAQVQHRYQVFQEWGFGKRLSHGKGLSVLFSGSSGTGKTMAAEVIADTLQLDLYKVDLSGVVSKYIGETEKNLSKIFSEAKTSNAILFFDEADALFGKRTEVSDAHDRYANIETSYLLQKMEEYDGVVILATNLRENLDEAFNRRIRFVVEFPFPDETNRTIIWRKHFPDQAPVHEAIDYQVLAKRLPVAGGSIKNIVLNAAFLAAEDKSAIRMEHIMHGAKREFEKIGKLWNDNNYSLSVKS